MLDQQKLRLIIKRVKKRHNLVFAWPFTYEKSSDI